MPNWWPPEWLIIATSYSGNTEETLEACQTAIAQGATIVVISSGGELSGMCELSKSVHLISCPSGQPPRSAFGHIFSRQLAFLVEIGILQIEITEQALERLQVAVEDNDIITYPEGDVASLALNLMQNPIAILGPNELMPAINRFKNQLNENSARFARIGAIPEMNHNELLGWRTNIDNLSVVFLRNNCDYERNKVRIDITKKVISKYTQNISEIWSKGESIIENTLYHINLGD